jgi:CO/xanthine dehydrogenase Mo-binding subunit
MLRVGDKKFNVLNKSKRRLDGYDKVTGRARYAADIQMPGMLHAGVKRSPYAHAKVTHIDVSAAKAIPGVRAVVTAADLPKKQSWAMYMYLTDEVKYVGDCVAMVAADTIEQMRAALDAIEVEYELLPIISTIEEALEPDAVAVHEKYPDNIYEDSRFNLRKGDIEKGFAEADVIIEREYRIQYVEHAYIEPEAAVAYTNPNDGLMTVHASAQNPFFTRRYVADILGIPLNRVRLIQEVLGGSFGGKEEGVGLVAARTAYLSHLTKKPVKLVFSREDSILESAKRHPFRLRYKIGAKKDGTFTAFQGEQVDNSGAYSNQTQFMNWRAMVHSTGPYVIPHVKTDTYGVFTNNVHSGAMRGYSSPQLIFGQEQLIDELAEELGIDAVELRRKNCLKDGSLTATSDTVNHVILEEMMNYTVEQTDYMKKRAENSEQAPDARIWKGIGLAIAYRGCGLGGETPDASGCMMIINEDGSATISTGLAENGQGLKTAYAQIAAEASGVRYEDIQFYGVDSYAVADSGMTVASRGTIMASQSVRLAGESMKKIMLKNALTIRAFPLAEIEEKYDLAPGSLSYDKIGINDIDLVESEFFLKKYPDYRLPLKNVSGACLWLGHQLSVYEWHRPADLIQDHHTGQGQAFPTFAYSCVVAEVEVDMKTGYVDVKKVTASHDVGTAVNPALCEGQIYGGIVMGQGFAIMEEVEVDLGQVANQNLDSYLIPTALDAPEMKVNLFESSEKAGTYETKSLGEPATETVGAAIANAVYNATGRRIREHPCDLERVLLGYQLRKKSRPPVIEPKVKKESKESNEVPVNAPAEK